MALSAAERQARSERAKAMHRQGRLGSQAVQRRASQRAAELRTRRAQQRASQIAQDLFVRHRDEVERALLDALRHGTRTQKIRAAETLAKLALSGERIDQTGERNEHQARTREELVTLLTEKFTTGPAAAILQRQIAQRAAIDSTAVEIS